jgi:hypothetical protein
MNEFSGINIQWPISREILNGNKPIETRTYPIPQKYLNKEILLVETPGKTGKFKSRAIGIIVFTSCFQYKNKTAFYNDYNNHLVDKNSDYAWGDKPKWGWVVEVVEVFKEPIEIPKRVGIKYTTGIQI